MQRSFREERKYERKRKNTVARMMQASQRHAVVETGMVGRAQVVPGHPLCFVYDG